MAKPRVTVRARDNGLNDMLRAIAAAGKGVRVTAGIHAEDGDGGLMLKANVLEFGNSRGAPPRAFISGYVDAHGGEFVADVTANMRAALAARKNPFQRADQMAQQFAGAIQASFPDLLPNAASTIRQKSSDVPGVDDGQLRAAVRAKVEIK